MTRQEARHRRSSGLAAYHQFFPMFHVHVIYDDDECFMIM